MWLCVRVFTSTSTISPTSHSGSSSSASFSFYESNKCEFIRLLCVRIYVRMLCVTVFQSIVYVHHSISLKAVKRLRLRIYAYQVWKRERENPLDRWNAIFFFRLFISLVLLCQIPPLFKKILLNFGGVCGVRTQKLFFFDNYSRARVSTSPCL